MTSPFRPRGGSGPGRGGAAVARPTVADGTGTHRSRLRIDFITGTPGTCQALGYNLGIMSSPVERLGVAVKIGSTSVGVLAATRLDDPQWIASWDLGLLEADDPWGVLHPVLSLIRSRVAGRRPVSWIVATGEVGRARPALVDRLRDAGWHPWVLTGLEEARASWWGVQAAVPRPVTVVDVGGGSTEIVGPAVALSIGVGAAVPDGSAWPREIPAGAAEVVAVGGTARILARWFTAQDLRRTDLVTYVKAPPGPETLRDRLGISPVRARLLTGGASVLLRAMETLGVDRMTVSRRDLRWGLWLAGALGRGREDPA
jgi:hypothetical protein